MKDDIKAKIQKTVLRKNLGERDVAHLMPLCRKYIEQLSDKEKSEFKLLNFFCDWTLHSVINRSSPAFELIKDVNSAIYDLKLVPGNDEIIRHISEIASFAKLRVELKRFLSSLKVKDTLTLKDESWVKFVKSYIKIILDVPLILSGKLEKTLEKELIKKPLKEGTWIIGISISSVPQSFFKGSLKPQRKSYLCLIAWMSDTTKIVIPLSTGIVGSNLG